MFVCRLQAIANALPVTTRAHGTSGDHHWHLLIIGRYQSPTMSNHDVTYGEWLAERERALKALERNPLWKAAQYVPSIWGPALADEVEAAVRVGQLLRTR